MAVRLLLAEAEQLQSSKMAKVILKNLKKVYPNAEKKKKSKKGEEVKKSNLQITAEGVVAVQDLSLIHIFLKKHLKFLVGLVIISVQRVAFLRKSSWRNSHAPFLRNRVRNGRMGKNFIGKSCSRNA